VARTWLTAPSGYAADALGWPAFYVFTALMVLPGVVLLWFMVRRGLIVDKARQAPA
jgi:PAT family beta-lactamase induction signal transducer AmpG